MRGASLPSNTKFNVKCGELRSPQMQNSKCVYKSGNVTLGGKCLNNGAGVLTPALCGYVCHKWHTYAFQCNSILWRTPLKSNKKSHLRLFLFQFLGF